jgi:hypothetical protein
MASSSSAIVTQRAAALDTIETIVCRAIGRIARGEDPLLDLPAVGAGLVARGGGGGGGAEGGGAGASATASAPRKSQAGTFVGARDLASTLRIMQTTHQLVRAARSRGGEEGQHRPLLSPLTLLPPSSLLSSHSHPARRSSSSARRSRSASSTTSTPPSSSTRPRRPLRCCGHKRPSVFPGTPSGFSLPAAGGSLGASASATSTRRAG